MPQLGNFRNGQEVGGGEMYPTPGLKKIIFLEFAISTNDGIPLLATKFIIFYIRVSQFPFFLPSLLYQCSARMMKRSGVLTCTKQRAVVAAG
jgi:hypothetical protein